MNNLLKENERLDDLELDNLMIIQDRNGYKFSTDSVLLANFAKAKPSDVCVDLCSGGGVVAILFSYKNKPRGVKPRKEVSLWKILRKLLNQ